MTEDRNSYKNITKSIGLFGGVQIFQIIVSLIKNKIVAVLLGPYGMGIAGMITSTTSLVTSLTGLGLHTSSVRDVSRAYSSENQNDVGTIVGVLRYLVVITGVIGFVVVLLFSKYLSLWSFGNADYTIAFRLVSVILLFDQLCVGQKVLMQGTFHYKYMAKASLIGSVVGLLFTVPLYYLWGIKAIVPAIILSSLLSLLFSTYYARKIDYPKIHLVPAQILQKGKNMITLGLAIALTGVINTGQVYILRVYISNIGSVDDVGLYSAGIAIVTQYIGVVLTAMGTDYSPRLAAASQDNPLFIKTINRQMKLLVTMITPLILLFILFIKPITILLYSTKFLPIIGMIEWIMLGMFFRAISWSLSFGYVARGDAKLFFWNEFITTIYNLGFSILGYKYAGFVGLGIAFCLTYVLYTIQLFLLSRRRFGYNISSDTLRTIATQVVLSVVLFVLLKYMGYSQLRYSIGVVIAAAISYVSYHYLNQMIGVKSSIISLISKLKNR